ncbi:MAG: WXG100 family type VII secretion target [Lachnospiraceae bacterium]|nr:WXG100 family type VII secretion target [Lachnospiraceae bacterium]
MALIRVTATQLKAQAEELRTLNSQYKDQVTELETCETNLASMWEGEARDAFHNAFNSDKTQMTNFYTLIEQYVAKLLTIAAKYEQAEATNQEIATVRNYQ